MCLFGDGKQGHAERVQTFRCQTCRTTFNARGHTPWSRLKTPSHQIAMVLSALAEGLNPSAAERVFGHRQATSTSLSDSCWRARADLARTLLLPSPPPTPPAGRTANTAPQLYTGALALAGHRPPLENYSCTPFGPPHANLGAEGHSLLAADPGTWLRPPFHQ